MTKVVHIQYSIDSAGKAALRLQQAFESVSVQSDIVSLQFGKQGVSNVTYLGFKSRIISKLDDKIQAWLTRKTNRQFGSFSYPVLGSNVARLPVVKNADIIYIHWALKGLLNFKSIRQLARLNKPVIVFMHDMWNITGGCHHSFDCTKYKTEGCNSCPVFSEPKKNDLASREFRKKSRLYSKYTNLYFISPSRWLYNCAKESLLTRNKPVFYIPNLFDNRLFRPVDKNAARQVLNLDNKETIIAFGAVSVNSPYKGWAYLLKALVQLKQEDKLQNVSVLIFGSGYNKQVDDAMPFKTRFVGYLNDEYSLSLVYNAADVFIVPSLADNLPTTVQESLSCGTPVVGFNVGGIPDMIKHKENGYLAKYKDAGDISEGIIFCISNSIKGYLLPDFEQNAVIKRHLALFKEIT